MRKNKIKGLGTPNFLVGIRGFMDARLTKTAVIDAETGQIVSGYITRMFAQLQAYEAGQIDKLENEVKAARAAAGELVAEYAQIRRGLEQLPAVPDPKDVQRVRQYQRAQERQRDKIARCDEIARRLVEIDAKLRDREHHVRQELNHTVGIIKSKFAAYGHGMMRRPVDEKMIPNPTLSDAREVYHEVHLKEDERIQNIIEEVYRHG